jgi:AcrR family transcriptional regulator
MSEKGVDGTTILEITERADVGFGTFYNYFATKDDIAASVLDCVIVTLGRRNDLATEASGITNPRVIIMNSIRAVGREIMRDRMWRWWLKRPDLLINRMREGFKPFALRDIDRTWKAGASIVADPNSVWSMMIWLLAGRVIDICDGTHEPASERDVSDAILRLLGVDAEEARMLSSLPVPPLPPAEIDFAFQAPAAASPRRVAQDRRG